MALEGRNLLNPDKQYETLNTNSAKEYNGTSSKRLISVVDVWKDYLTGKFAKKNLGITYMIIVSVIVDLSAFLFFNLARKNDEEFD